MLDKQTKEGVETYCYICKYIYLQALSWKAKIPLLFSILSTVGFGQPHCLSFILSLIPLALSHFPSLNSLHHFCGLCLNSLGFKYFLLFAFLLSIKTLSSSDAPSIQSSWICRRSCQNVGNNYVTGVDRK